MSTMVMTIFDLKTIRKGGGYRWTMHCKFKLLQYGLSPSAVKRVIRFPERTEEGIAPNTVAVMRRKDTKSKKQEVWVMYQHKVKGKSEKLKKVMGGGIVIISAWIYSGISPKSKEIFIPDEALMEIEKLWEEK